MHRARLIIGSTLVFLASSIAMAAGPSITSLTPSSGAVGATVTIAGSGFGATQGAVTFNGTAATPTSWTDGSIQAPVPAGATTGNVVVTVGSASSNGVTFTVTPPPSISSLNPSSGAVGSSVLIAGSNFGPSQGNGSVAFNGSVATVTQWSNVSVTATVPTGASTGNVVVTAAGGISSNGVAFTVTPTPAITGLSLSSGAVGAAVTISGPNFGASQGSSEVTFNGQPATVSSWSAGSIGATVPAGASSGNVVVTVAGVASNGVSFTVLTQPNITSVSPSSASVGTFVTVNGSNFGASQGSRSVTFNGVAAAPVSWTTSSISAQVPSGATTGNVVVTVGGQASNGVAFTVTTPPPVIISLSRTSGPVGTAVTVAGNNFGAIQSGSQLTFNGTAATPTSWNNTSITAPVPSGATTGNVVVNVSNQLSNAMCFAVVTGAPCITGASPASGSPGTSVTISGANFGSTQGTSSVTLGGNTVTVSSWNSNAIQFNVPNGAATGNIVVTVGGTASNAISFTVPAPAISNLNPDVGRAGTVVTIAGSNFGSTQGNSAVKFNGVAAAPTSWNNTSIVTPVPAGASTGPVTVTVGTQTSAGVNFAFTSAPTITSVTPNAGPVNTSVTVAGSGFGSTQGTSTINFNSTAATAFSWSDTSITVPVPAGATTGPVTVTAGGATSNGVTFTVSPAPAITSLSLTSGAPGSSVVISGSNFGASQGTSAVRFNGVPAQTTAWADGSITAIVPNGVTTGPVTVTVSGQTSNGSTFTAITGGTLSGSVTNASAGAAIAGATVQVMQSGAVQGSAATDSSGSYTVSNVLAGSYDVQVSAAGFGTAIQSPVSVMAAQTTTVNFSLTTPATVSGKVTKSDGVTAISGATVQVFVGRDAANTATSDGSGNYSMAGLNAGGYSVQASATGYVTQTQLVTLSDGGTTTANFVLQAPGVNPINYVYDELGRLVGVIDSSGDTATYTYDAVGNILAIGRRSSSQVSIINFIPSSGVVGAQVTISGSGFSATASQDSVSFNGTSATITSATATQIVTSVPAGATTGPITVIAPAGSTTSATTFNVLANSGVPSVASFTPPIGARGTAVTITGTNFDSSPVNNKPRFNITRAMTVSVNSTTLSTAVPTYAGSGHITVSTANGTGVSTQDFFIPFGTHVAGDVGFTGRVAMGGTQTVSLPTASKIGLLLFDASAGQGLTLQMSGSTFSSCTLYLLDPVGITLNSSYCNSATTSVGLTMFTTTGTHTIGIDPGGSTGSLTVSLVQAAQATLTVPAAGATGPTATLTIATSGQGGIFSFSGTRGQKLSFNVPSSTIGSANCTLKNPDGSIVVQNISCGTGASAYTLDTQTLAQSGTYTIAVAPSGTATGSLTMSINNDADVTGTIAIDGATVTTGTTVAGQDARLSFTATAGQRIVAYATNVGNPGAYVYLVKPDGTNQINWANIINQAGQTFFMGTQTLVTPGPYQLWVAHVGANFGNETLQIASVPADVTATLTVPAAGATGATSSLTISKPGQAGTFTFSGTQWQKLSFNVPSSTIGSANCTLKNPDGSIVTNFSCGTGASAYALDTQTLAQTGPGPYTIAVAPSGTATGSLTMSINNDADVTGTIAIDGATVTTGTTVAGQDARLSFTATAGQRIVAYATNVSNPGAYVYLVKPGGTNQINWANINNNPAGQTFYMSTQTLVTPGTYQLWVAHLGTNFGNETLQIASVPPDFTGTLTVGGAAVRVPTTGNTAVGQGASLTFSGTAGQQVRINVTNPTFGTSSTACTLTVKDPSNNTVTSGYCGTGAAATIGPFTTTAVTYTIVIAPVGTATGSVTLSLVTP